MAEEKSDGEIPGSDSGKNASSDTTPVADVTQDRISELHRPVGPDSADYGGHAQLAAGYLVDDTFNKSPRPIQAERRAEIDRASAFDPECYVGYGVKKITTKSAIMVTQIYPTVPNIKIVPDKR
tara:strand:+ start:97 stop:468 length:372 start_codon:yes stop_codon:yes gene_type:complete